jgi:putative transposase
MAVLCAGHGTRLKGEPTISNYGSQGKSQAQPDGGEGHSVITTGFSIPKRVPKEWVVDCTHVGKGISALKYLSRYLYRGVISEKNIISNQNGQITFKYIESSTGKTLYRTLKGEDFLHLILQHVLPKGFRRVRDYGFLHGNAKKLLFLVQLILYVVVKVIRKRSRPVFICPCCKSPMVILGFRRTVWEPG